MSQQRSTARDAQFHAIPVAVATFEAPSPTFVPLVSDARLSAILYLESRIRQIEGKLQAIKNASDFTQHDTASVLRGVRSHVPPNKTFGATGAEMGYTSMSGVGHNGDESALYEDLVELLQKLDSLIAGDLKMRQLQQVSSIKKEGLSTIQIGLSHRVDNRGRVWLMVNDADWAGDNKENSEDLQFEQNAYSSISELDIRYASRIRVKEAWERGGLFSWAAMKENAKLQFRAFRQDLRRGNPFVAFLTSWHVQFVIIILCLITFFAVGVIASTAEFSPIFLQAYFIIAIIWALSSSVIFSFLVRLFGGETKDAVAGFLAALGLWLVVIQIGQTRAQRQLDTGS